MGPVGRVPSNFGDCGTKCISSFQLLQLAVIFSLGAVGSLVTAFPQPSWLDLTWESKWSKMKGNGWNKGWAITGYGEGLGKKKKGVGSVSTPSNFSAMVAPSWLGATSGGNHPSVLAVQIYGTIRYDTIRKAILTSSIRLTMPPSSDAPMWWNVPPWLRRCIYAV